MIKYKKFFLSFCSKVNKVPDSSWTPKRVRKSFGLRPVVKMEEGAIERKVHHDLASHAPLV